MKIYTYITLLGFIFFILSCNNTKRTYYYDTGEVFYTTLLIDTKDSLSYTKEYYKNGELHSHGICNKYGLRIGYWEEFYADGAIKSNATFDSCGIPIILQEHVVYTELTPYLDIENHSLSDTLIAGHHYNIRTYVEDLHTDLYIVCDENYEKLPQNKDNPDLYPYYFIPHKGSNLIRLIYPSEDMLFLKSSNHHVFEIQAK